MFIILTAQRMFYVIIFHYFFELDKCRVVLFGFSLFEYNSNIQGVTHMLIRDQIDHFNLFVIVDFFGLWSQYRLQQIEISVNSFDFGPI